MAEIIPAGISGGAISQGQGQGWAQVLGQSTFDPVKFVETVAAKQDAKRQKERDTELANRVRNAKNKPVVPESNRHNEEEIYRLSDELNNQFAKAQAAGIDLLGTPQGMQMIAQGERELKKLKIMGDLVAEREKHYQDLYNSDPGKRDVEELNKWQNTLNGIKGIANKAKFVEENEPFSPEPLDMNAVEKDIAARIGKTIVEKGAQTTEQWLYDDVKNITNNYLDNLPIQELQRKYEQGKKEGKWDTPEKFREVTTKHVYDMGEYKETYDDRTGGGGVSVSVGGYRVPEKISAQGRSRWDTSKGGVDEVSISYNSKDVPPFEVEKNAGGEKIRFAPVKWFRDKDGKWMVEGKSYGRTGEERIKPANLTMDVFEEQLRKENPESEIVTAGDKATIFKPLKTEVVPYDLNDISFKSHLEGFDLYDYEQGWNKQNAGKAKKGATDYSNFFGGQ